MMELFERLVVAIEKVAERMPKSAVVEINKDPAPTQKEAPKPEPAKEEADSKYPPEDNREAWLEMCKMRKIKVPPRTKTATLVKNVKAWDLAHVNETEFNKKPEPVAKPEAVEEKEAVDPFAVTEPSADEAPTTREMVLEVLQKVQKDQGNAVVIDILKRAGGVEKLKDLPEDRYAAVYKEAKNG